MNKELIDTLRLDAGIARLADWDKALVCVGKDGITIDPLEGLSKFALLIVNETLDAVYKSMENGREIESYVYKHFGIE